MKVMPTISTLILLRHGQSIWNGADPRFTGWCDVPLTVKGRVEAVAAGQLLRSRGFRAAKVDVAFTSELQRSHESCELALASMAGHEQDTWASERIRRDWRLNERHYGSVQGLYKNDPGLRAEYGEETIRQWRRSVDRKPPPITDAHEWWRPPPAPTTESLADCQRRVVECFKDVISSAMFDEADPALCDRTVIVVAHANAIRSLMAFLDDVPDEDVPSIHVPNSVPILYRFERVTRSLISTKLQGAAGGSHARWLLSPENHVQIRESVQPGGMLTRALFDSWDRSGSRQLTVPEIEDGIEAMLADDIERPTQCTTINVVKKIVRALPADAVVKIPELEKLVAEEVLDIQQSVVSQNSKDLLGEPQLRAWDHRLQ